MKFYFQKTIKNHVFFGRIKENDNRKKVYEVKKKLVAFTTGAVIASCLAANPSNVDAASYTVKSGDSLWSIAHKHQTSIASLKSLNDLKNDLIFPKQVLQLDGSSSKKTNDKQVNQKKETTSSSSANQKTYTVKAGDSLSKIAVAHNISLTDLMEWNKLDTTLIYPNDVFIVAKPDSNTNATKEKPTKETKNKSNQSEKRATATYTVKSGDSLWKISKKYSMSITKLKDINNLSSDLIRVGQVLSVNSSAASEQEKAPAPKTEVNEKPTKNDQVDYNVDKLIQTAKSFLGTSYVYGGDDPGEGFDCSGFIYHVYNQAGKDVNRLSSSGYYNRSYYVNTPKVGDLVFFENTYKKGISHLGIYAGNNTFIHASSSGVKQTSLDNSYWAKHFDGYKRLY